VLQTGLGIRSLPHKDLTFHLLALWGPTPEVHRGLGFGSYIGTYALSSLSPLRKPQAR